MKGLSGDKWIFVSEKIVSMERFWTGSKVYTTNGMVDSIIRAERCAYFGKGVRFELVKSMWRKHRSIFQDRVNYIHNNIVKPLRVGIIHYMERDLDMNDIAKYLPPPSMKGKDYNEADWAIRAKEFS